MSLAHKLYKIGQLVTNEDIKKIIEVTDFKDLGSYTTLQIDFHNDRVTVNQSAVDSSRTMFTKKIGGTSNSYYLYPNFEYQVKKSEKKDMYKKFKSTIHTLDNSILAYSNSPYHTEVRKFLAYIENYQEDIFSLKEYPNGNYFLILTINGKTFNELMPEVFENYYKAFVEPHVLNEKKKKINGKNQTSLITLVEEIDKHNIDFITKDRIFFGYDPNVKFFTMDNYNDKFKPQIINKLPMSKETAISIKKGWMYAITHLKFYHKGLEYIIIPSMVNFDSEVYKRLLTFLKKSHDTESLASKEDSFIRRLGKQIEDFDKDKINSISLDILFTEVNPTNLSVKIFATLEDVIPSRISQVVKLMETQNISDKNFFDTNHKDFVYLKDYFGEIESTARATKMKGLDNKVKQEKIILAKILLGYERITYKELLKRFENYREIYYNFKNHKVEKKLIDSKNKDAKVKEWLEYPGGFCSQEDRTLQFLNDINAIEKRSIINE